MKSDSENNEILTVQEVAVRLRVKPSWVYAHADDLGAYRLHKYLRFAWSRVLERIENNVGGPDQRPAATEGNLAG